MGFGLLFCGWVTLLFFKVLPVGIIGCILMLKGIVKLEEYNQSFKKTKYACIAFLVYFLLYGVLWVLDLSGVYGFMSNSLLLHADELCYYIILSVYSLFLYSSLGAISEDVEFDKGIVRAKRASSLVIVFAVFTALRVFFSGFIFEGYLRLALFFFEIVWLVYTAIYLYSCYMMIANEEIINDEMKKMREYDAKYSFRIPKQK